MPSGRRHYRLTLADALSAHERALIFGGRPGVLNPGLIEAAISQPYCGYYRPIYRKSAALVRSMAGNHGFADGNKRTTLILLHTLLARSGYRLVPIDEAESIGDAVEQMILDTVTHALDFEGLVA